MLEYPAVIPVSETALVVFDGNDRVYNVCYDPEAHLGTTTSEFSLFEHSSYRGTHGLEGPSRLLDAVMKEGACFILSSTLNFQKSSSSTTVSMSQTGEYLVELWCLGADHAPKVVKSWVGQKWEEFAHLDETGETLLMVCEQPYQVVFPEQHPEPERPPPASCPQEEHPTNAYVWTQTPEDVTVQVRLSQKISKQSVECVLTGDAVTLSYRTLSGKKIFVIPQSTQLFAPIITHESYWTLEQGTILSLYLQKKYTPGRWPQLYHEDDGVCETLDPNQLAEYRERMQKYEEDPMSATPSDTVGARREKLEECDSEGRSVWVHSYEWSSGAECSFEAEGQHSWICSSLSSDRKDTKLCFQFDVDGVVYKVSPTENSMNHVDTVAALGYIQASKRDKRFATFGPGGLGIIVETSRAYVYGAVDSKGQYGVQRVVPLPHMPAGLAVLQNEVVILTEESLVRIPYFANM
jgi:hypothetical protein